MGLNVVFIVSSERSWPLQNLNAEFERVVYCPLSSEPWIQSTAFKCRLFTLSSERSWRLQSLKAELERVCPLSTWFKSTAFQCRLYLELWEVLFTPELESRVIKGVSCELVVLVNSFQMSCFYHELWEVLAASDLECWVWEGVSSEHVVKCRLYLELWEVLTATELKCWIWECVSSENVVQINSFQMSSLPWALGVPGRFRAWKHS